MMTDEEKVLCEQYVENFQQFYKENRSNDLKDEIVRTRLSLSREFEIKIIDVPYLNPEQANDAEAVESLWFELNENRLEANSKSFGRYGARYGKTY